MKKSFILVAALLFTSTSAGWAGGIKKGDSIGSFMLGAGKIKGNDRKLYNTGLLTSVEYLRYRSPSLGLGGEISLHVPEGRSETNNTGLTRRNVDGQFLSLLATARLNATPSGHSTPYVAIGIGVAQHQFKETLTPVAGGAASERKEDFWRGTYVLRFGWDCLKHDKWTWGIDLRLQYLDKLALNAGAGLRLGWRF
ncbi:MAG: hypothetical protein COB53_09870 [Elusimicrobia bacterium]|nr:MAG: hypothetical protein COB53_09870 [Elusimicrobiota bacterium]